MSARRKEQTAMTRISREELEALCWRLTGWRGNPSEIDRLLRAIDEYALGWGAILPWVSYQDRVATSVKAEKTKPLILVRPIRSGPRKLRCNHCGRFLELTKMIPDKRREDGRRTTCYTCGKNGTPVNPEFSRQRIYSDTNITLPSLNEGKFLCKDCGKIFPRSQMRKDSSLSSGVRNRCLKCEQVRVKLRNATH